MDAEQIRGEMRRTRASIDRKLDVLTLRTEAAKQDAVKRITAVVSALVAFWVAFRWWRHRSHA